MIGLSSYIPTRMISPAFQVVAGRFQCRMRPTLTGGVCSRTVESVSCCHGSVADGCCGRPLGLRLGRLNMIAPLS